MTLSRILFTYTIYSLNLLLIYNFIIKLKYLSTIIKMLKMKDFYDDVLKGDLTRIKNRSPKFPEFVLRSALQDGRKDIVDNLILSGIEYDNELTKQAREKFNDDVKITLMDYFILCLSPILISLLLFICLI